MTGIGSDLIGVIAAAVGAAAVLYAGMHLARKLGLSPAAWLLPAGIGLSMVAYSVWNDYAWFDRAQASLPAGSQVLVVGHDSQPWAPWTYLFPVETRFAALDPAQITQGADGTRRAPIMLVERRGQTVIVPQDFDCAGARIRPGRADWMPAGDDAAFATVCSDGGTNG